MPVLAQSSRQKHHLRARQIEVSTPIVTNTSLRIAMASRRLALNLHQGLRSQRALQSIKPAFPQKGLTRSLATPVSHGSTTESTTLSNGFTVCATPSREDKMDGGALLAILQLTLVPDRNRALSLRPDVDCWRMDRCRIPRRDRPHKWHRAFPRALGL